MKSLRNRLLTLLALTLFGGAGAWAQGPTNVTQFTTDLIASWQGVYENVTLADMQDLGFVATDYNTAAAWTGAPQSGASYLFYEINGNNIAYVYFTSGSENDHDIGELVKADLYNMVSNGQKYFYTGTAPAQAIELTKVGDNQWSLGQTPDYDLELQVEYYQPHALKEIPTGWQILVNGQDSTNSIVEGSLNITETDTVTLIPDNPRRVKSVTLVEPLQTLQIGGDVTGTFYYLPGETWRQAIQNHPTENNTSDEMNGWSVWGDPNKVWKGEAKLYSGGNPVDPDTAISSSLQYQLHW
jgi:hypothetical protein